MSDAAIDQAAAQVAAQPQQEPSQPRRAPGAELAAQRRARAWTIEQIAAQLNLAPRQIQALEEDNYAALPGMASVKGFIRAYAKLMKIDAQPLIAMVASEASTVSELSVQRPLVTPFFDNGRMPSLGRSGKSSRVTYVVLFAMLLPALAFTGYRMGWIPGLEFLSRNVSVADSAAIPVQSQPAVASVDKLPQSKEKDGGGPANMAAIASTVTPSDADAALSETVAVAPVAATIPDAQPAGKDTLVLKMREDTWLEILQSDNESRDNGTAPKKMLVSRLVKAGSIETYELTEPVLITIGNANGVDATLRGAPLDLKGNTRNNVVRLNLK